MLLIIKQHCTVSTVIVQFHICYEIQKVFVANNVCILIGSLDIKQKIVNPLNMCACIVVNFTIQNGQDGENFVLTNVALITGLHKGIKK